MQKNWNMKNGLKDASSCIFKMRKGNEMGSTPKYSIYPWWPEPEEETEGAGNERRRINV